MREFGSVKEKSVQLSLNQERLRHAARKNGNNETKYDKNGNINIKTFIIICFSRYHFGFTVHLYVEIAVFILLQFLFSFVIIFSKLSYIIISSPFLLLVLCTVIIFV
jgi:hypothetical protein